MNIYIQISVRSSNTPNKCSVFLLNNMSKEPTDIRNNLTGVNVKNFFYNEIHKNLIAFGKVLFIVSS